MADSGTSQELRIKALAAAEAIYRLTGLPSFDPTLKALLRKQATEILGGITGIAFFTEVRRIQEREHLAALIAAIQDIIRFAESRGLIVSGNAERVVAAYRAANEYLSVLAEENADTPRTGPPLEEPFTPNERQERILAYIAENGKAQLGDIRQLFGDSYSEKTLQRDLWQLVSVGRIQRQGDNRWTVYYLKHSDVLDALSIISIDFLMFLLCPIYNRVYVRPVGVVDGDSLNGILLEAKIFLCRKGH